MACRSSTLPLWPLWRREADRRTLYALDVRDPVEYRAGHLPGSLMAPGGQLVQETDSWLGVWGARVALIDDTGVQGADDRLMAPAHGLGRGGARRWARRCCAGKGSAGDRQAAAFPARRPGAEDDCRRRARARNPNAVVVDLGR